MSTATLLNSTIRHAVNLESLKADEVNQFTAFLRRIDKDLRERLTAEDLTSLRRTRLEKQLSEVRRSLKAIFNEYYDVLAGHLTDIGAYESEFESESLAHSVGDELFETTVPAPEQVRSAIFTSPLSVRGADGGKLLEPFIKDWMKSDIDYLVNSIRLGFFEGQTNFEILKRLRGTKARGYNDGALAVVDRHAQAIVRTAVQHTASTARMQTWIKNGIKEYTWLSTLDSRTSSICRSLDQEVFGIGQGPVPPAHINCRSTTIAKLSSKYDYLDKGATRATEDGPVNSKLSYYEWLKLQDADYQDDVLGPVRGKLFRDGGISVSRFKSLQLDKNFKPLTLDQMRSKESSAFERIGNDNFTSEENARSFVVNNGKRYQVEFAWAGDPESGKFLFKKRGQDRSVSFSSREIEKLKKNPSSVLYHNHPSGTSLSGPDLKFASHTGIKEIVAFSTHDDGEFRASVNFGLEELNKAYSETENYVRKGLTKLINENKLDVETANRIHTHAVNILLDRQGAINYNPVKFGAKMQEADEKLKTIWSGWQHVYAD